MRTDGRWEDYEERVPPFWDTANEAALQDKAKCSLLRMADDTFGVGLAVTRLGSGGLAYSVREKSAAAKDMKAAELTAKVSAILPGVLTLGDTAGTAAAVPFASATVSMEPVFASPHAT